MEQFTPNFESQEAKTSQLLARLEIIEGRAWEDLTEAEKRDLVELAATAELPPEAAERVAALVPRFDEMGDDDRALYLDTLKGLGLVTKEEIE